MKLSCAIALLMIVMECFVSEVHARYMKNRRLVDISKRNRLREWLTSKDRSHDDLDFLKAIRTQITQDVSVTVKLIPAQNLNMEEATMLANSGLDGAKSLWGKARKVYTAGVVHDDETGNILGGGYGVHWCGFLEGAVGCLNGTQTTQTERRAQLKAVHVALTQSMRTVSQPSTSNMKTSFEH